ncbi:MAG: hypothetical protein QOH79_3846, partial [Acidimicrobiaceae bacterium]
RNVPFSRLRSVSADPALPVASLTITGASILHLKRS